MKFFSTAILTIIFVAVHSGETTGHLAFQEERIHNASDASRYQFPYQVSYQIFEEHRCGGSILSQNWILTAAHCIKGRPENGRVVAGLLHLGENHRDVQIVGVAEQIRHPNWTEAIVPHDIGLLKLESPLCWTQAVQPIKLPKRHEQNYGFVWFTGWGALTPTDFDPSTTLKQAHMIIMSNQKCAKKLLEILHNDTLLDDTMICVEAFGSSNENMCRGDSGGPIQQKGVLLGVASWFLSPCNISGAPNMFTRVGHHLSFIKQYVPDI